MNPRSFCSKMIFFAFAFFLMTSSLVSGEEFYKGKTLRIIVGFSPGGGYDTFTRTIARTFGKYIPGSPTVLVENMTGAGSLVAANYLYTKAARDGLTAGVFNNSLIVQKTLGDQRIKIDFEKFGWIGAPSKGVPVCMIMAFTGLRTLDDILKSKKQITMGATRAGSTGHDFPLILNQTLGTKFKVIPGYKGTSRTRVALQSKELAGFCSQWESMRVTARGMLDAKGDDKLIPFAIHSRWPDPEVKDLPLFRDVIQGETHRAIYDGWVAQMEFQRPIMVPRGTPKERLDTLRKAFQKTIEDPDFQAEAEKSKLVVTYVSGDEVEALVKQIQSMSPEVKKSLHFLVTTKKK